VKCSKGTYIRSLARDLGRVCESRAYVSSLSRTTVGSWEISDSISPNDFNPDKNIISGLDLFNKIPSIDLAIVNDSQAGMILNGYSISRWNECNTVFSCGTTALFDNREKFMALIENKEGILSYRFVRDRAE
jgi:tRNA pseudouridine55 synthase